MRGDIKPNIQLLYFFKKYNKKVTKRSYNRCCKLMESSQRKLIGDFLFFSEHFRICFVMSDLLTRLMLCV